MNYDTLIQAYEVDVQYPDVSGMEHLDMLMNRSEIANIEPQLTVMQRVRVYQADKRLLEQANLFFEAIHRVADIVQWRREEDVSPSQWWWYLDVLTQLATAFDVAKMPIRSDIAPMIEVR